MRLDTDRRRGFSTGKRGRPPGPGCSLGTRGAVAIVAALMATPPVSLSELRRRMQADLDNNILLFWAQRAFKPDGNLVGVITHDLREFDDVPRHVVLCARILWTFAAAARRDPRPEWLAVGRKALALLDGPFRDTRHGGFFWSLTRDLRPHSPRKQVYAEAFTIYGLTEWYQATGDTAALARAKEIFELIERHAREPKFGGYIEALDADWGPLADMRLSDKDLNSPKSNNTLLHILEAYTALLRVWPDARVRAALRDLLLDLEGIAWWEGSLLLGLKEPLTSDRRALIWRLADPAALLRGGRLVRQQLTVLARLDLTLPDARGLVPQGVSDLFPAGEGELGILSTSPDATHQEWGGVWLLPLASPLPERAGDHRPRLLASFRGWKPEGGARGPDGRLTVVFDDGAGPPRWLRLAP